MTRSLSETGNDMARWNPETTISFEHPELYAEQTMWELLDDYYLDAQPKPHDDQSSALTYTCARDPE